MSSRDLEFLYEIGTMRHMARTWHQFGGLPFANLADHSMRVAWIAMMIGAKEGGDLGKIALMALVHDVSETRTGDVHYVSRMYTKRNEDLAIHDTLSGTALEEKMLPLWEEAEKKETLEAKIVKDADNLDCDLEFVEQSVNGVVWGEKIQGRRLAVRERLFTETARQLFDQIYESNPHDWHRNGRNRLTTGDWSKPVQKS